jgi:CheY-like chemotaxis protein
MIPMDEVLTGRRVLVVEDEMLIFLMIEGMLEDLGFAAVTAAATIDQALGLIDTQAFDVAMLDLNLQGQKSYPIADRLAARGVPFLFSTGYGDHGLQEGYGDRPVLNKPFQQQELAVMLRSLLRC